MCVLLTDYKFMWFGVREDVLKKKANEYETMMISRIHSMEMKTATTAQHNTSEFKLFLKVFHYFNCGLSLLVFHLRRNVKFQLLFQTHIFALRWPQRVHTCRETHFGLVTTEPWPTGSRSQPTLRVNPEQCYP